MLFKKEWITTKCGTPMFPVVKNQISSLTNKHHLTKIAKKAVSFELRAIAISKLNDQKLLISTAKTDPSIDVKIAALRNIVDSNQRLSIVTPMIQDSSISINYKISLIDMVKNEYEHAQDDLRTIALSGEHYEALRAALLLDDKETAQKTFLRIALDPQSSYSQKEAVKYINNDDDLLKISKETVDEEAAFEAAQRIKDPDKKQLALIDFAINRKCRTNSGLSNKLSAAIMINDIEVRIKAIREIYAIAKARVNQKSGTYTWQDRAMLEIADRCRSILGSDADT